MLPDPVGPTVTAREASARPQLRLAARTVSHPGLDTVAAKETLGSLDRSCESVVQEQEAGVAELIGTLVENVEHTVGTLQAQLATEQAKLTAAQEQLELELAARVRLESENEVAARLHQQQMSDAEAERHKLHAECNQLKSELALVRRQLATAKAECSKLRATFQFLQNVLAREESETVAVSQDVREIRQAPIPESRLDEVGVATASLPPTKPAAAAISVPPEVIQDIDQMLSQVEEMYKVDLTSGRLPMAVVDALTANLRYARQAFVARSPLDRERAEALFEQQLTVMLDLNGATEFGRHLSIAAYAAAQSIE